MIDIFQMGSNAPWYAVPVGAIIAAALGATCALLGVRSSNRNSAKIAQEKVEEERRLFRLQKAEEAFVMLDEILSDSRSSTQRIVRVLRGGDGDISSFDLPKHLGGMLKLECAAKLYFPRLSPTLAEHQKYISTFKVDFRKKLEKQNPSDDAAKFELISAFEGLFDRSLEFANGMKNILLSEIQELKA
jgi:hypothetical protein